MSLIKLKIALISMLCLGATLPALAQRGQQYLILKAGLHFDSQVSGGKYSLPELAKFIDRSGLDVAIITDHDNMKVSYGIRPFDRFLKFSIEENSIATYRPERYINEINLLDRSYPRVILIPGVEAVPYYRWEGSPMTENLVLKNWHTHLLVFGIEDPRVIAQLPSIANGLGYRKPDGKIGTYIIENITHFGLMALYFFCFFLSAALVIRRKRALIDIAHINRRRKRIRFSPMAFIFTCLFGVILYFQYPFLPLRYTQYDAESTAGPFQSLIDYVNRQNGLIFWAHPEVTHQEKREINIPLMRQTVAINTDAYPQYITETVNYTGFAIFWEGMKTIGKPGGLWDIALSEYCAGIRKRAPWAIGELDFEESNDLSNITETSTFLFAKERTRAGVYEAFRAGRMYATRGHTGDKIILEDFSIYDLRTGKSAFIGETLTQANAPLALHIRFRALEKNIDTQILVFRNTTLFKKIILRGDHDEWFADDQIGDEKTVYYRLYVGESWPTLVTNPIFVHFAGK